jgi:multiple sugar transport system permease protein
VVHGQTGPASGTGSVSGVPVSRHRLRGQALWGLVFVAPAMLLFLVFALAPVVWTIVIGFDAYDIASPPDFVGVANYANLVRDPEFGKALLNTLIYVVGTVPAHIVFGLALALLLNLRLPGQWFFRSACYVPGVTSVVAASLMWLYIYNPQVGAANIVLQFVGLPPQQWLLDLNLALPSIIVMSIWQGLGSSMLIYLAGLQGIPAMFYEAAAIDGANAFQRFLKITWPLLRPTTLFVLVTSCIGAFQVFQQPYVMTRGGPLDATMTVVLDLYLNAFHYGRMGYASAMAVALFAIILLVSLLNLKLFRADVQY